MGRKKKNSDKSSGPEYQGGEGEFKYGHIKEKGDQVENELTNVQVGAFSEEYEASAGVWENENHVAGGTLSQEALSASASAQGFAGIGEDGLEASGTVSAEANIYKAEYETGYESEYFEANAQGSVAVGAGAEATGELTINPLDGEVELELQAEAFIGVKAEGSASAELGGIGAEAEGSIGAGLGAELEAEVGFEDGKFEAEFGIGAYLGVGGSLSINVSVDVGKVWDTGGDVLGGIGGLLGFGGGDKDEIENNLKPACEAMLDASESFLDTISDFN